GVVDHVFADDFMADGEDQIFGGFHRLGAIEGQLQQEFVAAALHGGFVLTHFVHQAKEFGLLGREDLRGNEVAAGLAFADGTHHVGADYRGDQSEFDFTQAEAGLLGGEYDVAAGGQADSTAESGPLHKADDGLGQVVQHVHQSRQLSRVVQVFLAAVVGHAAHPAEIRPGGEVFTFGAQDHNVGVVVGVHVFQRVDQLL